MIKIIESECNLFDIKKSEDKILKIIDLNRDNIDINYLSEYLYLHSLKKKNTIYTGGNYTRNLPLVDLMKFLILDHP